MSAAILKSSAPPAAVVNVPALVVANPLVIPSDAPAFTVTAPVLVNIPTGPPNKEVVSIKFDPLTAITCPSTLLVNGRPYWGCSEAPFKLITPSLVRLPLFGPLGLLIAFMLEIPIIFMVPELVTGRRNQVLLNLAVAPVPMVKGANPCNEVPDDVTTPPFGIVMAPAPINVEPLRVRFVMVADVSKKRFPRLL